jgi:hypothetical protein
LLVVGTMSAMMPSATLMVPQPPALSALQQMPLPANAAAAPAQIVEGFGETLAGILLAAMAGGPLAPAEATAAATSATTLSEPQPDATSAQMASAAPQQVVVGSAFPVPKAATPGRAEGTDRSTREPRALRQAIGHPRSEQVAGAADPASASPAVLALDPPAATTAPQPPPNDAPVEAADMAPTSLDVPAHVAGKLALAAQAPAKSPVTQSLPCAIASAVPPEASQQPASPDTAGTVLPEALPSASDREPLAPQPVPASAAAAPSPTHTTSPAAQIVSALVQAGHTPDGTQRLTLRLEPPELGHVEIRVDRPAQEPARVDITVEKPETLVLLLRDQPQLQHTLDQAGIPAEGRSISFHVAPPETLPRNDPGTAPAPGVAAGGPSNDGSHGHNAGRHAGPETSNGEAAEPGATQIVAAGWVRGGLDITA